MTNKLKRRYNKLTTVYIHYILRSQSPSHFLYYLTSFAFTLANGQPLPSFKAYNSIQQIQLKIVVQRRKLIRYINLVFIIIKRKRILQQQKMRRKQNKSNKQTQYQNFCENCIEVNIKGVQLTFQQKQQKIFEILILDANKKCWQICNNQNQLINVIQKNQLINVIQKYKNNYLFKYLMDDQNLLHYKPKNQLELKTNLSRLDQSFNFKGDWLPAFEQVKKIIYNGTTYPVDESNLESNSESDIQSNIRPSYNIYNLPQYYQDQTHSKLILDYFKSTNKRQGNMQIQKRIRTKFKPQFDKIKKDLKKSNIKIEQIENMIQKQVKQITKLLQKENFLKLAMYKQGLQYWKKCIQNHKIDKNFNQLKTKAGFKIFGLNFLQKKLVKNLCHQYNVQNKFLKEKKFSQIKLNNQQQRKSLEKSLKQLCRFKKLMGYYRLILETFLCSSLEDLKSIDQKPIMKKMLTMCVRSIIFEKQNKKASPIDHQIHLKFEKAAKFYLKFQLYFTPKNIVLQSQKYDLSNENNQIIKNILKIFSQEISQQQQPYFQNKDQFEQFMYCSKNEKHLLSKTKN